MAGRLHPYSLIPNPYSLIPILPFEGELEGSTLYSLIPILPFEGELEGSTP